MIKFLPVYENDVIAVRVSGKLTHEEYQTFLPQLETQIHRYGKISVLIELDEFVGWELAAMSDDFKFARKHSKDIEKFAFVGNKAWQRWITMMAKPFVEGQVKYFPKDDMHKAWDWVRDKEEAEINLSSDAKQMAEEIAEVELLPYQNILVAVDFSAHSIQAVKRAAELANHYEAKLTLLHMVEESNIYDAYYDPINMDMMISNLPVYESQDIETHNQKVHERGEKQLKLLAEKIGLADAAAEVLGGTTATGIISYAEAQQSDLIVMGTHGRHGISRLLGSVARSVQSSARCEVLIVPLVS